MKCKTCSGCEFYSMAEKQDTDQLYYIISRVIALNFAGTWYLWQHSRLFMFMVCNIVRAMKILSEQCNKIGTQLSHTFVVFRLSRAWNLIN